MKTTLLTTKYKSNSWKYSLFTGILLTFLMISCQSPEKKAQQLLDQATTSKESKSYTHALDLLDSLQKTYPKAFKTRHIANKLKLEIQLDQQQQNDSLLTIQLTKNSQYIDSLLSNKSIEAQQDKKYQDAPLYVYKRLHKSSASPARLALFAAEQAGNGYVRLYLKGDKRNVESIQIKDIDNNWTTVSGKIYTHIVHINGTHTLVDIKLQDAASALETYLKTAASKTTKATIQIVLNGQKTEKVPTLSSEEVKGMRIILPLHQAFANKVALQSLSKECSLKIRFIKKRLESYQ